MAYHFISCVLKLQAEKANVNLRKWAADTKQEH